MHEFDVNFTVRVIVSAILQVVHIHYVSSLQYSASRGVTGTPTFYVNGFVLPDAGSPLDYNAWRRIIDPLISAKGKGSEHYLS